MAKYSNVRVVVKLSFGQRVKFFFGLLRTGQITFHIDEADVFRGEEKD